MTTLKPLGKVAKADPLVLVRPLALKPLSIATGYSRSTICAMRRGYFTEGGEFRQLKFSHGRKCVPPAVWEWDAANPEFRCRKAVSPNHKRHASRKVLSRKT